MKNIKKIGILVLLITSLPLRTYALEDDISAEEVLDLLTEIGIISTDYFNDIRGEVCGSEESIEYVSGNLFNKIDNENFLYFLDSEDIIDLDLVLSDIESDYNYYQSLSYEENIKNVFKICVGRLPTTIEMNFYSTPIYHTASGGGGGSSSSRSNFSSSSSNNSDEEGSVDENKEVENDKNSPFEKLSSTVKNDLRNLIKILLSLNIIDSTKTNLLQTILGDDISVPDVSSNDKNLCPVISSTYRFARSLNLGSTGEDVRQLQRILNNNGYNIANSGPGSLGNESTYFGQLTKNALIRLQNDCSDQILAPVGLLTATGFFGQSTIDYLK